ncbi:MAG TPA: hypothetical protein VKA48_00150, partial [Gammaproteobacteria bacterium]|nr:hypothetical protein [Gammaproteobacteria bacterium]
DLRRKRARDLARNKAEEIRKAVAQGASLESQLKALGVHVEEAGPVTREDAKDKLPSGLAGPLFAAPDGGAGTAHVSGVDFAVFKVLEVIHPKRADMTKEDRKRIRSQLRRERGQSRLQAVLDHLRERYEVRINKDLNSGQG